MLGTKIVLDEEKIINEGKYDVEEVWKAIDEMAEKLDLVKINGNTFIGKGNKHELAQLGIFIYDNLVEDQFFTKNVKEWLWYEDNITIDLIESMKKNNFGIW